MSSTEFESCQVNCKTAKCCDDTQFNYYYFTQPFRILERDHLLVNWANRHKPAAGNRQTDAQTNKPAAGNRQTDTRTTRHKPPAANRQTDAQTNKPAAGNRQTDTRTNKHKPAAANRQTDTQKKETCTNLLLVTDKQTHKQTNLLLVTDKQTHAQTDTNLLLLTDKQTHKKQTDTNLLLLDVVIVRRKVNAPVRVVLSQSSVNIHRARREWILLKLNSYMSDHQWS